MEHEVAYRENNIVKEIHDELFSMDERTDSRVQSVLKKAYDKNYKERIESLRKLGFTSSSSVRQLTDEHVKELEVINDALNEYSVCYPGYKFILDEDLVKVCKKYNLVMTSPDRFTGSIPDKNQEDILNFKSKHPDIKKRFISDGPEFVRRLIKDLIEYSGEYVSVKNILFSPRYNFGASPTAIVEYVYMIVKEYKPQTIQETPYSVVQRSYFTHEETKAIDSLLVGFEYKNNFVTSSELFIAASPDMVRLQGCYINRDRTVVHSLNYHKPELVHVPDPIVLKKVNKGAIIITAWGEEASDPLIVNHNSN